MTSKLKDALDSVKAEDTLKANSLAFLKREIGKRGGARVNVTFRKFAVAVVSAFVLTLSGVFSYNLYFTPNSYVDMDVNPSIELVLNRFDRIIDTNAYNYDGKTILDKVNVKHKNYGDAIRLLLDVMLENGFTRHDNFVSVTVQTKNNKRESQMLSAIESAVRGHHGTALIEAFSVDGVLRDAAHDLNLSPAKYIAIQELIAVDRTATVDSCRGHSIVELKQLTKTHSNGHHGDGANNSTQSHHSGSANEDEQGVSLRHRSHGK